MKKQEDVKEQIILAAAARFRQYGYGKTTMAEIAKDCDMSAANLYRFFKSKIEIASASATSHLQLVNDALRDVVRDHALNPSDKLVEFTVKLIRINDDAFRNEPNISELCNVVCLECMEVIEGHKESKRALVAEIMAEGNQSGEFDISDIIKTSEMFCKATIMFDYPDFYTMISVDKMERYAHGVVEMIIKGLAKK